MKWPKPPSGLGKDASWFRQLLECAIRCEVQSGPGYRVRQTATGTILDIDGSSPGGQSQPFQPYIITNLNNGLDYFSAQIYNFATSQPQGATVNVAKALEGRQPPMEYIDGNVIVYSNPDADHKDNIRTAEIVGTVSQFQVMNPRYIANGLQLWESLVMVAYVLGGSGVYDGNGNMIYLCEFQPFRKWVYQWDQSGSLPDQM
jgi:hypothetical protein